MTTIDWASLRKQADEASRPIPGDTWYDLVCEKAEATVASTGSEMIKATLKVESGPHQGRPLFTNFVLTPDNGFALNIFFTNISAFGIDPARDAPGGSLMEIAMLLPGRRVRGKVGIRNWQGQPRNEIQEFTPQTGAQIGAPGGAAAPAASTPTAVPAPAASTPTSPTPQQTQATPSIPTPATPDAAGAAAPPELPF